MLLFDIAEQKNYGKTRCEQLQLTSMSNFPGFKSNFQTIQKIYIHVAVVEPGKTRAVLYVIDSSSPETIGASTVSIICATSLFYGGDDLVVLNQIIPISIN